MKGLIVITVTILGISSISFAADFATCVATCFIQRGMRADVKSVIKAQAATKSQALANLASQCEEDRKQIQSSEQLLTSAQLVTSMDVSAMGAIRTSFNATAACL